MATTSSAMRDLSDQNPVGTRLGTTSTDLIAFYGSSTAVSQAAISSAISTTAYTSTAPYGFATSTEALQVSNAVSTIAFALKALGLVR